MEAAIVEKRPRSIYLLHRRYQVFGRWAALAGGFLGFLIAAIALVPMLVAGRHIPVGSFAVAVVLIAGLAFVAHAAVRWRWRVVRGRHDEY